MADALGISTVSIKDLIDTTSVEPTTTSAIVYTIMPVQNTVVTELASPISSATANIPGPQGRPGDQTVYSGETPPENPQKGWVWIRV